MLNETIAEIVKTKTLAPIVTSIIIVGGSLLWVLIKSSISAHAKRLEQAEDNQRKIIEHVGVLSARCGSCHVDEVEKIVSEIKERSARITTMVANQKMRTEALERFVEAVDVRARASDERVAKLEAYNEATTKRRKNI